MIYKYERFTVRDSSGKAYLRIGPYANHAKAERFRMQAADRLASYEETDMLPEEVTERINKIEAENARLRAELEAAKAAVRKRIDRLEKIKAKSLSDQVNKDGVLALLDGLLAEISGPQREEGR